MQSKSPNRILISRTDSIGDVVLTLPLAGVLRKLYPHARILFLGQLYTYPVIKACSHIDEFINWKDIQEKEEKTRIRILEDLEIDTIIHVFPKSEIARLAKKAGINNRIGATGRLYHWLYCNQLVALSRKKSDLHEAQLNLKLIRKLGAKELYTKEEIMGLYGLDKIKVSDKVSSLIPDDNKFNLILHPKSKGSAREWGLDYFEKLINLLPKEKYNIFVSGTAAEQKLMPDLLKKENKRITDITGKFTLIEFMEFISLSDGLIAASTGPLHIASAIGKLAIGIYPPIRPMHPERWAPIGMNAKYMVANKKCIKCRKDNKCDCMREISPEMVYELLERRHFGS